MRRIPAAAWFLALAAVSFWIASAIHFGVRIPIGSTTIYDPYPGARIPEAIVGVISAVGAAFLFARATGAHGVALGAAILAGAVTVFGLTITVGTGRTADIAYHIGVLLVLAAAAIDLVRRPGAVEGRE